MIYTDKIKYLGHIITSNFDDNDDVANQIRALYIRSNGIVRRFKNCNVTVKKRIFETFCYSCYGAGLWFNYSNTVFSKLRVAYNDSFRFLFNIPRYDHVSPYFVEHRITPFMGIIRKCMYSVFKLLFSSNNVLISNILNFCIIGSPIWDRWFCELF
jgi:hypothetical protein